MARTRVTRCSPFRAVFATPRTPAPDWMTAAGPAPWGSAEPYDPPGDVVHQLLPMAGQTHGNRSAVTCRAQVLQRLRAPGPEPQHRADLRRDRPQAAQPALGADQHRRDRRRGRPRRPPAWPCRPPPPRRAACRSTRSTRWPTGSTRSRCPRATSGTPSCAGVTRCSPTRRPSTRRCPTRRPRSGSSATTTTTWTSWSAASAARCCAATTSTSTRPSCSRRPPVEAIAREQIKVTMAAVGFSVVELRRSRQGPAVALRAGRRPEPPDHRVHAVHPHRSGRGQRPGQDRGRPDRPPDPTAPSATAPAAPRRGAPSCPARRTSTATSWPPAPRRRRSGTG